MTRNFWYTCNYVNCTMYDIETKKPDLLLIFVTIKINCVLNPPGTSQVNVHKRSILIDLKEFN